MHSTLDRLDRIYTLSFKQMSTQAQVYHTTYRESKRSIIYP
jgi:hypothetical protein